MILNTWVVSQKNTHLGQAWDALNALINVSKADIDKKAKVFKQTVKSILNFGSESWRFQSILQDRWTEVYKSLELY